MAGSTMVRGADGVMREPEGHAALWRWFGLSRAAWLTLPRSLMHEMPDEWQHTMAQLLEQFDATYRNLPAGRFYVQLRIEGRFQPMPQWLEYRYPDIATIESFKGSSAHGA